MVNISFYKRNVTKCWKEKSFKRDPFINVFKSQLNILNQYRLDYKKNQNVLKNKNWKHM